MKKIIQIYFSDVKNIFTHPSALVVIIALCVLPSLYAWLNIKASWDPYAESATHSIRVAVVNEDAGLEVNGRQINIGDTIVQELKKNPKLGWEFENQAEAFQHVQTGKYYAMIEIPHQFTREIFSITTADMQKGQLIYTVNEKINAIAPKLTEKGATSLQEKISKQIVNLTSDIVLKIGKELDIELESALPSLSNFHFKLKQIQQHFGGINQTVDKVNQGSQNLQTLVKKIQSDIPFIEQTLQNASTLDKNLVSFLKNVQGTADELAPSVLQNIKLIENIANEIQDDAEALKKLLSSNSEQVELALDHLILKVEGINRIVQSTLTFLKELNQLSNQGKLDSLIQQLQTVSNQTTTAINQLQTLKSQMDAGQALNPAALNQLIQVCRQTAQIMKHLSQQFESVTHKQLELIFQEAVQALQNAQRVIQSAQKNLPQATHILDTAYHGIDRGTEGIQYIQRELPKAEALINKILIQAGKLENHSDVTKLLHMLTNDIQARSDFLSNPIEIKEHKLFTMENYGTAMTPFYTVLSLWVGLLLLSSILSVHARGDKTAKQEYFGKLLLFLTIAIIQAGIVAIGDLYLLKVYCLHPVLFILGSIFTAIAFTWIVYSLVSVFGNVGKVISIILLVLQVAGSGGTFPVQLTPRFFQVINPFLPFTYAISLARETIGGIVWQVLIQDSIILCIYIILSVLIGVIFKRGINKLSKGFVENFHKSGLGE